MPHETTQPAPVYRLHQQAAGLRAQALDDWSGRAGRARGAR